MELGSPKPPSVSKGSHQWAGTNGPHQSEETQGEGLGSRDMTPSQEAGTKEGPKTQGGV